MIRPLQSRVTVTDAAQMMATKTKTARRGQMLPGFLRRDPSRPFIVLDNFPPYVSVDDILMCIGKRAEEYAWKARHPELGEQIELPITYVEDLTTRDDYWFVCVPEAGIQPEVLRDQLLRVHGVTDYVSVGLPRPLATMIRTWTHTHQHEDIEGSLTALEDALSSRRLKR